MHSTCPYCFNARSMAVGNIFCSNHHNADMHQLQTGAMLMKLPRLELTDTHVSRLSIRLMLNGEQFYRVGSKDCLLTPQKFLLINQGQTYQTAFDVEQGELEMMLVAFRPGFAEGVLHSLTAHAERLLDDPFFIPGEPIHFHEQTYDIDPVITQLFQRIHRLIDEEDAYKRHLDINHLYTSILERIFMLQWNIHEEVNRIDAVKMSTRQELYRRVSAARDYIEAHYREPLSLEVIARTACLSIHHFKRLFKAVYNTSPHQYVVERRLTQARRLLLTTDWPVQTICEWVGFHDTSSFIRLFRSHFGNTPGNLRIQSMQLKVKTYQLHPEYQQVGG